MSKRKSIAQILNGSDIAHKHDLKLYEINMLDAIYDSREITYRPGKSEDVLMNMIKRGYILIGVNDRIRLSDEGRMIVIEYKGSFLMSKMNAYWKDIWIDALRNGKYIQGCGVLREGNRYCCLGVLADKVCKKYDMTIQFNQSYLPPEICEKVGIDYVEPIAMKGTELQSILAQKNDSLNDDFKKIADWIELNL